MAYDNLKNLLLTINQEQSEILRQSEAIFLERGWVLSVVYNAARGASDLVIVNAQDMSLAATLHLKHHIPYGLHGSWVDKCFT